MSDSTHRQKSSSRIFLPTLIVSVFFGLLSGGVAAYFIISFLAPFAPIAGPAVSRERLDYKLPQIVEGVATPVENAAKSVVLFFPSGTAQKSPPWGYLPQEAAGAGVALTSDGWLISHAAIFGSRPEKNYGKFAAVIGNAAYELKEMVRDPFTDIVFLKVDASNLAVLPFGKDGARPGESLFVFDAGLGPRRADAIAYGSPAALTSAELLHSSERAQKVLRLSRIQGALSGSAVLNRNGEVIGMYASGGESGSSAIPLSAFAGQIGRVLKDKVSARPVLGVHYLDLSRVIAADPSGLGHKRGALLAGSPDGKIPAIARNSPAFTAGLRLGDIITAVSDEEITTRRALSDILAEYSPDSAVTLSVRRGEVVEKVEVKLGSSVQ